jgi:hypothetical protein
VTARNRESLKRYFQDGALPAETHFADLIDSMLNMNDEGFRKSVEHGYEVYAPIGHDALMSFYRDQDPETPRWRLGLGGTHDELLVQAGSMAGSNGHPDPIHAGRATAGDGDPAPLLCLDPRQRIGIGTATPQTTLDVAGTLRSRGRCGTSQRRGQAELLADGEWQDLTDPLAGCQAFEIVAGAGHRGAGRFGLLHAIAVNSYNPTLGLFDFLNRKRGIRCTHGYYSRRCDRLQLRWAGSHGRDAEYRLQIRTGCDYGAEIRIQAHLTQLWFDPHMELGQP